MENKDSAFSETDKDENCCESVLESRGSGDGDSGNERSENLDGTNQIPNNTNRVNDKDEQTKQGSEKTSGVTTDWKSVYDTQHPFQFETAEMANIGYYELQAPYKTQTCDKLVTKESQLLNALDGNTKEIDVANGFQTTETIVEEDATNLKQADVDEIRKCELNSGGISKGDCLELNVCKTDASGIFQSKTGNEMTHLRAGGKITYIGNFKLKNYDTKSELLKALKYIIENNERTRTEALKCDLLSIFKNITELESEVVKNNVGKRGFSRDSSEDTVKLPENIVEDKNVKHVPENKTVLSDDETSQIRNEIDKVISEAQLVVKTLLNTTVVEKFNNFVNHANKLYSGSSETLYESDKEEHFSNVDFEADLKKSIILQSAFDFIDVFKDIITMKDAPCIPMSGLSSLSRKAPLALEELDEHILEAPEEFRSSCDCESLARDSLEKIEMPVEHEQGDSNELLDGSLKCRDARLEPERGYTERVHDNTATPEADTCGRATKEEMKSCENEITVNIYAKNHVKYEVGDNGECISEINSQVDETTALFDMISADYSANNSADYARNAYLSTFNKLDNAASDNIQSGTDSGTALYNTACVLFKNEGAYSGASKDNDQIQNAVIVKQHVGLATPTSDTSQVIEGVKNDGLTRNLVTVISGSTSLRFSLGEPGGSKVDTIASAAKVGLISANSFDVTLSGSPEGRDETDESCSMSSACECAENPPTTVRPSIENGVERCAQPPGCSRDLAVPVCVALDTYSSSPSDHSTTKKNIAGLQETNFCETDFIDRCVENSVTQSISLSENLPKYVPYKLKNQCTNQDKSYLCWGFKNGRLVFDVAEDETKNESEHVRDVSLRHSSRFASQSEQEFEQPQKNYIENSLIKTNVNTIPRAKSEASGILSSKDLNKKPVESRQLKLLELKLKEAGITDGTASNLRNTNFDPYNSKQSEGIETNLIEEQVVNKLQQEDKENLNYDRLNTEHDKNANPSKELSSDRTEDHGEDIIPADQDFEGGSLCEFDASKLTAFAGFDDEDFYVVYDELDDSSDDESEQYHLISRCTMRGDGGMGTNGERKQHNPDRDNLKSLLKKPGRGKDSKKNRVVFNENKNEFFDADYIILIREECDYDEEDDDGICTCNQHEMVRLTCCEPNCNCNAYEGFGDPTPQSPKFAPPLEFVDAVTLSPPEEYKDMELEEQQLLALQQIARRGQRGAVCKECSATHEDEGDGSQSDNEEGGELASNHDEIEEKEKTDQSQQTTPTTPPADSDSNSQRYILETITMTTVSERRMMKEVEEDSKITSTSPTPGVPPGGSPISGILKGGRLWKQASAEINNGKMSEPQQATDSSVTSDDESGSKRSVRFIESEENKRDSCDGAPEKVSEEGIKAGDATHDNKHTDSCNNSVSPESTEMMLTFKLGKHVLISNNSLKPNSAVRQLFPCTKPLTGKSLDDESVHQYLVTAESLRAFEEAKRAKLPQIIQSGETDESIKRAIERNTLRRSLIRYEPRTKKNVQKTDNSLVERIKQLTCDVDEDNSQEAEEISQRASPPGEEARNSPEVINKNQDKSFSPSSSSTTSSNSSSMSSTYKKITDLFAKREKVPDIQNVNETPKLIQSAIAPDLGNGTQEFIEPHCPVSKVNSTSEARKQFLSTLAPLTACVSSVGPADDYYYHMNNHTGDRTSVASSIGTEYSLEDIDEGLKKDEEEIKRIAPDVLAGTPSASESSDELAMFVQQDASRIERIKKKYQPETAEEDDEHDDYGFNRRPSVRGIKPRFGSTTEILQQIQNQMQPPNNTLPRNHVAWPYYSETNLSGIDNTKSRNINQNVPTYQYSNTADEIKRAYIAHQYRPTALIEENIYQNCTNQRCTRINYRTNMNVFTPVVKVGGGCSDYYQSLPRNRNGRPHSPPPQETKNYHQTMVYIPYNHIEGYQPISPNPYYSSNDPCYSRVNNQNQINKRYLDPIYQQRVEDHYQQKPVMRPAYTTSNHLVASRSESPLPGQFSTARATQTPVPNLSTCTYYPPNTVRYRPMVGPVNSVPPNGLMWQGDGTYVSKLNRHSFPAGGPRYPPPDSISLTDSESQHSGQIPNGYRQSLETCFGVQKDSMPNSPTKPRFIERGVPEGAASVSPQDTNMVAQSTGTSPMSPQNPPPANAKPLFYAMNV